MRRVLFVILAMSILASVGYCQEAKSSLQLTITSDKQTYEVGEKIEIGATLTNIGSEAFYLNTRIFFHPEMLQAIVKGPNEIIQLRAVIHYNMKMPEKSDYVLLHLGEFYESKTYSEPSRKYFFGYDFRKAGDYAMTIEYSNDSDIYFVPGQTGDGKKFPDVWFGKIASNTITIEVVEKKFPPPSPDEDETTEEK